MLSVTMDEQLQIFVPDRFDMLQRRAAAQLDHIVVPVDVALKHIKHVSTDMNAAGRGAFLLFRGDSGSGKSTFLNTLGMFLEGVEVLSISRDQPIEGVLSDAHPTAAKLRVLIIEGRDALREVQAYELESAIHDINAFIRTSDGERTVVVWPVNADDLEDALVETAKRVGGDSLLGVAEPSFRFSGPPVNQFIDIARRTIGTLNQGATLADLGVSDERAQELAASSATIGHFLGLLRKDLLLNQTHVQELLEQERCRLWIVVAAGNDPEGDIAGLTRGTSSTADVERLIGATNANIVEELKGYPDKLGILGAVLDAKILHLPLVTASALARDFADQKLTDAMIAKGLSVVKANDALVRLAQSDIARAFSAIPMGPRTRGPKPGPNSVEAFRKLSEIASKADQLLNAAVGRALMAAGYITNFETEKDLRGTLTRYTDVVCASPSLGIVRLEVMWRASSARADIANYALTKLYNYGRAIGLLQ
jgi:energy-coupling factor transporter ATP-binding protein EcfA2